MIAIKSFAKDPDEQLDYSIDWSELLTSPEEINASEWTVTPAVGLTVVTASFSANAATIWIAGGVVGQEYLLTNRITTNSTPPRIFERSLRIRIVIH